MRTIGIAGLQLDLDRGGSLGRVVAEIRAAKSRLRWVDMLILSELATYGASLDFAEPEAGAAEQTFRSAIEHARSQGAMLLALRAAVSLGRSLRRAGRCGEARSLIVEISQSVDRSAGRDMDEANALLSEMEIQ